MKTSRQIKVNNRVLTVIECSVCGATTSVKATMDTRTARKAIQTNGAAVSVPIYIAPTKEQNKALLNAVRDIAREGDNAVERQLGVNEENL